MYAHNLFGSRCSLRHHPRWMRRNAELRFVHSSPDVRRRWCCQCLRVHVHNLFGSRQELRHHPRWMRRNAKLRDVHRWRDLRRWWRGQCLRQLARTRLHRRRWTNGNSRTTIRELPERWLMGKNNTRQGNSANGCEVSLKAEPNNCGVCGNACGFLTPTCGNGSCI